MPQSADLPGGFVVVRHGHRIPGSHGGTEPADHLVSQNTSRTASSVSGCRAPATGRSREIATGAPRFRYGNPTTRPTRASTSTAASTSWSATSGCGPPICTGPTSTSSPGPTPTTPPDPARCAASPTCSTCGSTRGRCRTRRCTIPFENADWFDSHYPGDFIVEYIGQTRGWFYTLHVLATALFDRPAFKTCVAHGIVLGSDGQKMSKSLRNYPDVSPRCSTATAPTRCAGS